MLLKKTTEILIICQLCNNIIMQSKMSFKSFKKIKMLTDENIFAIS